MGITVKQASKLLKMTEDEVMELVSAGRLSSERKGKRMSIDEDSVNALLPEPRQEAPPAPSKTPRQMSFPEMMLRPLAERLSVLEKTISEKLDLAEENRRLTKESWQKDQEIAARDVEIEKLKRDLLYQKRLLEKEIEDRMRVLEEKAAFMDRELTERIARERDEFENRLLIERSAWSDRLAREQERYAASLAELQNRAGFWTRLVRMLTWS